MQIESFINSLSASVETRRAYRHTLQRFLNFLRENKLRVTQVRPSTIQAFLSHLENNKGRTVGTSLSPATMSRHLGILSSYFQFLNDNSDRPFSNPVDRVKRPTVDNNLPRAASDEILATLINGITSLRDKAIILAAIYSGLRLSELCSLDKDSITARKLISDGGVEDYFGFGEVIGKGRKLRDFIVGPAALHALTEYLRAERLEDSHPALFLAATGDRLSPRTIEQILDKWCKRLNISHLYIHQLRHSFATRNVNAGMSLVVLQSLMGHARPDTTARYFRISPERKTREYFSVMEYIGQTSPI